jgi:hypothetical protein
MLNESSIIPRGAYIQATEPTDKTQGKRWYKTTTKEWYTSDGTTYIFDGVDMADIGTLIGLNGLNILDLTAQASLTAGKNANFERDIYTDANGYLNSINTVNTTATFDTNKYKTPVLTAPFVIITATDGSVSWSSNNCSLSKISSGIWALSCTVGTDEVKRAQIMKSLFYGTSGADALIDDFTSVTGLYTSDVRDIGKRATLINVTQTTGSGSAPVCEYTFDDVANNMDSSTWSYCNSGVSSNSRWEFPTGSSINSSSNSTSDQMGTDQVADEEDNPTGFKGAGTHWSNITVRAVTLHYGDITLVSNTWNTGSVTDYYTDNSIPAFSDLSTLTIPALIVELNEATINSGIINFMIVSHETMAGVGAITYDVSFDGGANYQTGLSSFTEYTVVDAGTGFIIKQNFNGGDLTSSNYAEASDIGVLLW